MPTKPPKDLKSWLGGWTEARIDEVNYNLVLSASGISWPVRKLFQQFKAEREFMLPSSKRPLLIRSKMLTGESQPSHAHAVAILACLHLVCACVLVETRACVILAAHCALCAHAV